MIQNENNLQMRRNTTFISHADESNSSEADDNYNLNERLEIVEIELKTLKSSNVTLESLFKAEKMK